MLSTLCITGKLESNNKIKQKLIGIFKTKTRDPFPCFMIFFRDNFYNSFNHMNYFQFAFPVCKPIFTTSALIPYYLIPVNQLHILSRISGNIH